MNPLIPESLNLLHESRERQLSASVCFLEGGLDASGGTAILEKK